LHPVVLTNANYLGKPVRPPWREPKPAPDRSQPYCRTPPYVSATCQAVFLDHASNPGVATGKNPVGGVIRRKPSNEAEHRHLTLEDQLRDVFSWKSPRATGRWT